jgi:hypothetical protein
MAANQALEIMLLMDRGNPLVRIYTHSLAATPAQCGPAGGGQHGVPDAPAIYARVLADPAGRDSRWSRRATTTRVLDFHAPARSNLLWVTGQGNNDERIVERAGRDHL